ncbi:cysteine proteinase [Penicillium antarcticum]|uniref:cysteine proteinase n=1 Tax=Penicillium antarcticum TaxID=416450 RepID=UPI002382F7BA|nr:cysteine proteinase [Penicillium antarcticum]KAJ5301545.1 cysteine proteinase [Penicillium antarcticum]
MGSSLDWPLHPIYSPAQLSRYFDKLNLPSNLRREVWDMTLLALNGNTNTNNAVALSQMEALQRYQLASVPFENVDLHYSFHRSISTDTQTVLEKIVDSTSHRGGYCMENNILFGAVLQSMGYRITSVGGRVNEAVQPMSGSKNWKGPKYDGWNHMVNIVTIEGQKYLVDVGFGSNGPHKPIPLIQNYEFHNTGDLHGRLIHGPITQHGRTGQQPLWQYDIRVGDSSWIPAYCFTEMEFYPEDFKMMNYFMSTNRASWFTFHVVCVRMLLDDEGKKVVGDLTLFNNTMKRRLGATSEVLQTFNSDEERVAALEKYFKITLSRADRESIRHTSSEIL